MVRRICGTPFVQWHVPNVEFSSRLGIVGMLEILRNLTLSWFGHVKRKALEGDWVIVSSNIEVAVHRLDKGKLGWRKLNKDISKEVKASTSHEALRHHGQCILPTSVRKSDVKLAVIVVAYSMSLLLICYT